MRNGTYRSSLINDNFNMEIFFRLSLLIAGIINAGPVLIAFLPSKIKDSYGIILPDSNFELLLRHRAVLFGIIGGLMIYSAITKKHYDLSTLIGIISMASFLLLYFLMDGEINEALTVVMKIDVFAILLLLIGYTLHKIF